MWLFRRKVKRSKWMEGLLFAEREFRTGNCGNSIMLKAGGDIHTSSTLESLVVYMKATEYNMGIYDYLRHTREIVDRLK